MMNRDILLCSLYHINSCYVKNVILLRIMVFIKTFNRCDVVNDGEACDNKEKIVSVQYFNRYSAEIQ